MDVGGDALAVYLGRGYGDGVVSVGDGTYFWDRVTRENESAVEEQDFDRWRQVYARRLPADSELPSGITTWDQLTLVHVRPFWARRQTLNGMVLVGDAAGVVHPHSAMGANLALEDATALANILGNYAGEKPTPARVLASYAGPRERRRRRYVVRSLLAAAMMDATGPIGSAVRSFNLGLSRVGPARRTMLELGIG